MLTARATTLALLIGTVAVVGCGGDTRTTGGTDTSPDIVINGGPPSSVKIVTPKAFEPGKEVIAHSACLACHQVGKSGNRKLASNLTHVGSRMSRVAIVRSLERGPGIMPSYRSLGATRLKEVADFLSHLK